MSMTKEKQTRMENELQSRMDTTIDLMVALGRIMKNAGVNKTEQFWCSIDRTPMQINFYNWEYFTKAAWILEQKIQYEKRDCDMYPHKIYFLYREVSFEAILKDAEYEQFCKIYSDDFTDEENPA